MTFLCLRPTVRPFFVAGILLCGVVLLVASVLSTGFNLIQSRGANSNPAAYTAHSSGYSYVGEDYPSYYLVEIRDVTFVPENTVHYGIAGSNADEEWLSVFPPGQGFVQLGQNGRRFGISLYHQMHCLDHIRRAIGKGHNQHIHHCFNYLRQSVLCEVDATIKPGVPNLGDKVVKIRVRRTCKDWTQVYEAAGREAHETESQP
ncbi:hypothetical protein V8D89_008729 [Ganoderma adspersum]